MSKEKKAIILMCLSALCFALMASCAKKIGIEINSYEKIFYRNLIMVILIFVGIKKENRKLTLISKSNLNMVMLRSILGLVGALFYFISLNYLPLGEASILNKLSPFFVIVFSRIFLKEKIIKHQIVPLTLMIIGALFVIKPSMKVDLLPMLIGVISGMAAGGAYTVVRYLSKLEDAKVIIFYFGVISLFITFPLMIIAGYKNPNLIQLSYLIGTGIFSSLGQLFLSYSLELMPGSTVAIYQYLTILFSVIIGYFFYGEMLDYFSILGGLLIIFAAILNYKKISDNKKITIFKEQNS